MMLAATLPDSHRKESMSRWQTCRSKEVREEASQKEEMER